MKLTIEVDDEDREAINRFFGEDGKASHEDVRKWAVSTLAGAITDL